MLAGIAELREVMRGDEQIVAAAVVVGQRRSPAIIEQQFQFAHAPVQLGVRAAPIGLVTVVPRIAPRNFAM